MSVIHESLKRAREARQKKTPPVSHEISPTITVRSERKAASRLVWLMSFFVLAEGAFFVRESALRQRAEEKMKQAYLELNDARGDSLDVRKKKKEMESRVMDLQRELKKAVIDKTELISAKRSVELENLEKEKKISALTKDMHRIEMSKYQLKEEVDSLKRELSKWSSPLPIETEKDPASPNPSPKRS